MSSAGDVTCTCKPGFEGDGRTCIDIDECASDNGGCHADAICTNTPGSRTCACKPGFEGDGLTCIDVDECASDNGGCDANAICTNTPGSRTCECEPGFEGDGFTCTDVDECASDNGGCDANAICTNTPGSRFCECRPGFIGNGLVCGDVDECAIDNGGCDPNATCTNTPGSRTCECRPGFAGNGLSCADIDECLTNNGGCDPNAICINTPGSRTCQCRPGFIGNGLVCGDVDECAIDNGGCDANATCTNTPGSRTCACNAGFTGDGITCTPSGTSSPCPGVPTSGQCVSANEVEFCFVPTGSGPPSVRRFSCAAGETCIEDAGGASCVLAAACRDGELRCRSSTLIDACENGAWVTYSCPGGCNESILGDFCAPAVATRSLTVSFAYEARGPNASRTDWSSTPSVAAANSFLVFSFSGGRTLDVGVTDATGSVTLDVPQNPATDDRIVVALAAPDATGELAYVVANPGFTTPGEQDPLSLGADPKMWSFAFPSQGLASGSTLTITEAMGSGAARVFDYLRYAYNLSTQKFGKGPGQTLVAWLGYGTSWSCGACFADIPVTVFDTAFQSQIWIPADADQAYWADSVTAHELGHWAMSSFGTSPLEGGTHYIGIPTFPGQAWSEGFATWFSSNIRGDSVYLAKQNGSMFWLDIASRFYSTGYPWQRADPAGGLLQKMDENEVSAMLWSLSTSSTSASDQIYLAFSSAEMNTWPFKRGYTRHVWKVAPDGTHYDVFDTGEPSPSLPDFLDALVCGGFSPAAIDAATEPHSRYPYFSSGAICSGSTCAATCASGCCLNGTCQPGTESSACGYGGNACVACAADRTCVSGSCLLREGETCTDASCASGLCLLNPGSTDTGTCRDRCDAGTCSPGYSCVALQSGGGACVPAPAPDSLWQVYIYAAGVKSSNPLTGSPWDTDGSAPDPFACLDVAGRQPFCTTTGNDTYFPTWDEGSPTTYTWSELQSVTFTLWDDDTTSYERIDQYQVSIQPPWAGLGWSFSFDHSNDPGAGSDELLVYVLPQ